MIKKLFSIFALAAILAGCEKESGKTNGEDVIRYQGEMTVLYQGENVVTDGVEVSFDKDAQGGKATLRLYKVKFVPAMPALDINVPQVEYRTSGNEIAFSADGVVPTYGEAGIPAEMYTVTGLEGKIKGSEIEFSLSFGSFPTSYHGTHTVLE
ncbi:MAG: calycin-like domain-containing protein [Candidatus Cryptobacteroides sp.]